MEAHFTKCVSDELTKTLGVMGMPTTSITDEVGAITVYNPTYAEVFDWLLCKGISVELMRPLVTMNGQDVVWTGTVSKLNPVRYCNIETQQNWWKAAETAIYHAICMMED